MEAQFACADLSSITDEDLLRKMWQQAEDFSRKKEIRAYMYKLREQRLKEFYASNDSSPPYFLMDNASATFGLKKSTVTGSHGDSLVDQSFESFKTKEIRDSESPTRFGNMAIPSDNSGWQIRTSQEVSEDGKMHTMRTTATTQGIKEIDGGRTAFVGKNLESHSELYDGDERNFVHSTGDQSSTVLVEDSVTEDANGRSVSGSTHSTKTSVSTTRVVYQQQNGDAERPNTQVADATDLSSAGTLEFGDDHFSSSQKRTVTSSSSSSVLRNSATTKNTDHSTNRMEEQTVSGKPQDERLGERPKELSKDPERVREAFRLAQGSGKIIEREETMVNTTTKMITETKRLDDGTTVTTRTYEKIAPEPASANEQLEQQTLSSTTKRQQESVGRAGRSDDSTATNEFIRQEKANQSATTKTSTQRIMVEVDAAHDSFARSLRSVSPTGSMRSVRSNATLPGRTSTSPEKTLPLRTESDTKPDYMRSTFTSERKVSGFQEQQTGSSQRSPSPRKVSEATVHAGSRSTSPTKTTTGRSIAVEHEKTTQCQTHLTDAERTDGPEVDGVRAKPPLVRSETYEERCRKMLGMPNRPADDEAKAESKSIFSTYDNTVTVQQSRSELREQRKKIEQEIKSMESKAKTAGTVRRDADEQDSVVEKEHTTSRKSSLVTKESATRKLSSPQTSPVRKSSPTPKDGSPTRKGSVTADISSKKSPTKEVSPSRKAPAREISPPAKEMSPAKNLPTREDNLTARKSPTKTVSPTRASPAKDSSPTRHAAKVTDVSTIRKSSHTETTTVRTLPAEKETSPARKPGRDSSPAKSERVASPTKPLSETTTKSKATILVEQKQDGRNISVAEITILPVMEVSENVRTKTTATRTQEKILTKQSSDTKFDRRSTTAANSRVITNKSSSDFDVKRRAAELATQSKTRSSATSPDKRRPATGVEKPAPVKQNHITVAKIKIESMRKPSAQTKSAQGTSEETSSVRSSTKRTSEQVIASKRPVEPETDPESSKDTGISDNSEVEETVESVIEMNVTGTSCCRHMDRKDSAPVYRTTAVTRTGKNYSRSSSDNHLRATNASSNRQTTNQTTMASKSTAAERPATGGRKVERPAKHVATKTINLSTKAISGVNTFNTTCSSTLGSDHLDNVVIDIQLAKSSREPTPNKLIPIPVSPDTEDTGKPRYPDAVQEPEDETSASRQSRTQRVNKIPIFEEATNEYVGCEITEVDETTTQHATRITNLDRVTEDDESLLSVTEKVNKFAQEARRLQEPANGGTAEDRQQPARFAVRPEYDDIDEHLKSDECLLSVSDKVTKFISTAEEVKKIRTSGPFLPENEDVPVKVSEGDECLLSVNEKVSRFANRIQRTADSREYDSIERPGGRLETSVAKDQIAQKMQEEEEEEEEDDEEVTETKRHTAGVSETVSSKFVPQKSPELVKNAMRSTARHIVQDAAAEDLAQSSGTSIANRYRTTTMSKQFEKQTPATVAPCASPIILRSTEAVKKAKEIFEKGQTVQDARQRDILNRPSVWEDRRNKQNQSQPQQADQKLGEVKLTDIGVTERKSAQAVVREAGRDADGLSARKESVTKVERVQESETAKTVPTHGSGVRPPAYIRDTVSSKKDLFEKRISSSKMQVEYTTQTSQEGTETSTTTTTRRQSLKQVETGAPSSASRPVPAGDQSKPSYMNHTVASLEHINANQRRDSLDHGVPVHHEPTTATARNSITGSAKFGVDLKRLDTSNRMTASSIQTNATGSKRKASAGDGQPTSSDASSPVIEETFDLELLERMLESVTGYEQRRRIRAQIRVVKKQKEQQPAVVSQTGKQTNVTSVKTATTTHSTTVTNARESSTGNRKDSSPTRSSTLAGRKQSSATVDATDAGSKSHATIEPDTVIERNSKQRQVQVQQSQEHENARNGKTNVTTSTKTTTVVTDRLATKTGATDRHAPAKDDRPIWATSNILKKASENTRTFKSSSVSSTSATTGTGGRKVVSSSSTYQQTKSTNDPKTTTDCITSSYGVGPTDENGLPLFGIRALKKKAAPVPATATEDTKISGTIITETLYAENGGPTVGKRSTTHYSNEPGTFADFGRSDDGQEMFAGDASRATKQKGTGKMMAIRKTETIDASGAHSEELEVMDGAEMRSKVVRKGSVKELTERFIHRESSGSLTQESTRTYPKAGLILRSSGQSQSSRASTPATDRCSMQSGSVDEFEQEEASVTTREVRSFLNDTSKVTDVSDVLQRMSNADNVTERGDTAEDQEARALLNKFLGASVLMSGVESMVSSTGSMMSDTGSLPFATATKKVSKVSSTTTKTQTVKSSGATPSISTAKQATVDNLEDNWDEAVLKQLLESTTNYDDRRKIRARIRQVMAEKEACADIVAIVTADLQRERQLQQQATPATASATPERPSASAATVANGLSQGESLLLPLLQGLLLSNAAAFGYKGNAFAGNADEAAGVSSGGGSGGVADGGSVSHISGSTGSKLGAMAIAAPKMPPVEDSGTESGEDLRLLAAAGAASITNGTAVHGAGGVAPAADNGFPTILSEVASALDRLQSSLQADPTGQPKVMQIDTEQRRALLALIARLQEDLQQPDKIANLGIGIGAPDTYANRRQSQGQLTVGGGLNEATSGGGLDASQNRPAVRAGSSRFSSKRRTARNNRHTVGVSREELADARRFIEEMVMMDSRHQTDQCATSPDKAYILQKQQSLGTVLRAEPEAVPTTTAAAAAASVSQPQTVQDGGNAGTAPATAFAMKRPSQFVPKEMQNGQTSLDKLVLGGPGGKPAAMPSPAGTSQVRTKLPKDKLLVRQSVSVDQDLPASNGVGVVSGGQDAVKPIDLHKHKQTERLPKNHYQPAQQQPPPSELPFKKPTQTIAQRALVKKYSFNDGSSSDEDVARHAQRKTSDAAKTAEQMVLRNKLTPAEQPDPTGSIVINTVQKIVSRETKPASGGEVPTKGPTVIRRQQHLNGSRALETHKDDMSARPLNKYASKKLRMKRANTIDLPKSLPQNDTGDDALHGEHDAKLDAKQEQLSREQSQSTRGLARQTLGVSSKYPGVTGPLVPPADVPDFKPRTENDLKFMAFLQKQNQQSRQIWSNPVREHVGSNNWTNKFDHLKSNFEQAERRDRSELPPKYGAAPKTSAMSFWKQAESGSFDEGMKAGPVKQHAKSVTPSGQTSGFKGGASAPTRVASAGPATTAASPRSTQSMGKYGPSTSHSVHHSTATGSPMVEGKLILPRASPGSSLMNQFSHAPASAFKPIPKKIPPANLEFKPIQQELDIVKPIPARISNATGLVKQIVATGFKETPEVKPEPMHVQLGLVRSLAAQGYQETPYVPLPKLERTPTHNVLNYKPRSDGTSVAEPAPPAPWVGKRSSDVTGPAGSRVASIAATKFTANSFGHNKPSLPVQQPLTYQGSLKYAEKPLTYQQLSSAGTLPYEKRASLPDVSVAHLGTFTFTDYTQPESVSTFTLNRSDSLTNPENAPLVLTSMNSVFSPTTAGSVHPTADGPNQPHISHPQQISYLQVNVGQQHPLSPHSSANDDDDEYDCDDLESIDSQEMRVVTKVMQAPQGQQATYTAAMRPTHLNDAYDASGRGSLIAQNLHSSLKKIKEKSPTPPKSRQQIVGGEPIPAPVRRPMVAPQVEVTMPTPDHTQAPVPSHAIYNNVQPHAMHRHADQSLARTKSSHSLAVPSAAQLSRPISAEKQRTVEAYFTGPPANQGGGYLMSRTSSNQNLVMRDKSAAPLNTVRPVSYAMGYNGSYYGNGTNQQVEQSRPGYVPHVQQTTTRTIANTKMESQDGSAVTTRTTVTTKTVAASPKPMSPFAKFRQLDKQNSISSQSPPNSPKTPTPTTPSGGPMFKFTDPALNRRAATVKDQLLQWCQMKTKEYENVKIENFSTSWSDGMAFCALVHHFLPDAFDFSKLTPQQRRHNFTLAFRVADEKAGIAPLLDVDDMVAMRKPDWKCVFTYVQSIYRRFKNEI